MRDLTIRPARPDDLESLARRLGQRRYFADRLGRQSREQGVLLTAWQFGLVVGVVYLWLEPAEEPEIRLHLPGVPLITHVEVHRQHRGEGIGTRLIDEAENVLAREGFREAALAVELTNHDAEDWYGRMGYRRWRHGTVKCYSVGDGNGRRRVEICIVMSRLLAA
ncbi:GNAT family N-acetyltransferase [Lentzea sp. NPDC060358]|uniref:GNAT family N-acetyltransferase n=1 Tax=Lentzea sp. NPDC060358 TaxID=3347103 RepID=UPI0036474F9E